ncbi:MAG: response regulator [Desulfamplus sp.]|nr:response regulator [Desulfamplus sp.]
MSNKNFNYNILTLILATLFLLTFCAFVFFYEKYEYREAESRFKQHGIVISNSLWNLDPQGTKEYLTLACKSHNYKKISVIDTRGNFFQNISDDTTKFTEAFFTSINLIPEINLESDVMYNGKEIGKINAVWKSYAIYSELYVLFALILAYAVCHLNIGLLRSKNMLEKRVRERTTELSNVNAKFFTLNKEILNVNDSLYFEIQEHRRAREELYKSEEKYRILIENIPDILCRTNMEDEIVFISRSCETLSGYTAEEAIGRKSAELFYETPENRAIFLKALEQKGYVNNYEEKLKKKNGSSWWASTNAHFFKDANGNIAGIEGIFRDVTSKIMLENELRQAQKMESIGILTGGIAHDFNNILSIMIGNAELALDSMQEWDPVYVNIESIKIAGLKASGIVKQLLSFSRKSDIELEPVNIAGIVNESFKLLRSTIPSSIELRKNIKDNDAIILGNQTQIHQIIINLCVNASHAMDDLEGIIEIGVEKCNSLNTSELDYPIYDHVKITVTDTGHGIDPNIIDKIFDPYFSTKPIDKGTGMGLAVVHGIVKTHNGLIKVHSKPLNGTTFNIFFPLVTQIPEIKPETINNLIYGEERILFVDDDELIVEMTQDMLERLGYKVESTTNPEYALERFIASPNDFDLMITDMTMPQMSGAKLAERIRQIQPDFPVIICSGYSSLINEETAHEIGLSAYIMKPVSMQEMGETIRNVLDKHKLG